MGKVICSYVSGVCSVCQSEDVSYGAICIDGNSAYYPVTCRKCLASGKEWYDITYTETIMEKEI